MKPFALALAFLAAFAVSAHAADPYNPEVPESYDAPVYAFTGFGIGIDGGGQFNAWDVTDDGFAFDGISSDGLVGGAHLEYLFAVDRFRFGAYGEGGFSDVNTTLEIGPNSAEFQQDHYYGAGLKAGVIAYGSTLLYGRVGYDWSRWNVSATGFDGEDVDVDSWLIGGGVDTMLSPNWSMGLGVDYLVVDDMQTAEDDLTDFLGDSEAIRAKVRLTYRQ